MANKRKSPRSSAPEPLWYKDAIIYQLHVRAYCDADGDGIGDFRGLTSKLDYIADLGVTAIWLLPFYPSPLRDDGYDIADYNDVHPSYGTLKDFETFVREAHARGLRVITELVINHTSDQHAWFQKARSAKPGSKARDFYVWSDDPTRYGDTRIIFQDFEASNWTWDPVANAYYWHRFYSHQPDLNFENPAVRKEVFAALDFWLSRGVDGLRLDAVPYLYEAEGTNCENLPETHAFLRDLRAYVDKNYEGRMLLAEANQWPEDAVAYFGDGDECHMSFHFPVMPRLFMSVHQEDRFPLIDILEQTPAIPEESQWAIFLRNHDELTLEMVTDEERDYMYRVYAANPKARINLGIRRRLAPLLRNDRRKIELLNALLMSLPGTPVIYYGDEIGMGDNIYLGDRNGVRTPMQWNADRNAGFSKADPQSLYLPVVIGDEHSADVVNVEAQSGNPHSLHAWMRRLIGLRRRCEAFGRGDMTVLEPENRKVLAFVRTVGDERILVVANLSRFVQFVELDLSAFKDHALVEMFGANEFPPIGDLPYLLTLGPHGFYWFSIQAAAKPVFWMRTVHLPDRVPVVEVEQDWLEVARGGSRDSLEAALSWFLPRCRWFGGKARKIRGTRIADILRMSGDDSPVLLMLVEVDYVDEAPETYAVALTHAEGEMAQLARAHRSYAVVADLRDHAGNDLGVLFDAPTSGEKGGVFLDAVARKRRVKGEVGSLVGAAERSLKNSLPATQGTSGGTPIGAEQSNTSISFDGAVVMKLFRRIEFGTNPDVEVSKFLSVERRFVQTPEFLGALTYHRAKAEFASLGIVQRYVPNEGDAWDFTRDVLAIFYEEALSRRNGDAAAQLPGGNLVASAQEPIPVSVHEAIGPFVESARLLGERTAQLHVALAADDAAAFRPEPMSTLYQRSLYQSCRVMLRESLALLKKRPVGGAEGDRNRLLNSEEQIDERLRKVIGHKLEGERIRTHGDFHLGQVLYTGKDFVIIDFEGEPIRSLGDRRLKRPPLRDVAGMLRSFHYAAHAALFEEATGGLSQRRDLDAVARWARYWSQWVSVVYLAGYFEAASDASFLPSSAKDRALLLDLFMIEKALYEIRYELNHRPNWVAVPMRGILDLLAAPTDGRT